MDFLRLHLPGLHQALRGALDSLSTFVSYLMGDEVPTVERREAQAAAELVEVATGRSEKPVEEEAQEGLGGHQNKEDRRLRGPEEAGRCQEESSASEQAWEWGEGSSHGSQADGQDTGTWEAAKTSRYQKPSAPLEIGKESEAGSGVDQYRNSQIQESKEPDDQEVNRGETLRTREQEEEEEEASEREPGVPGGVESEWTWHREPEQKGSADGQKVASDIRETEQAIRETVVEDIPEQGVKVAGREEEVVVIVRGGQSTEAQGAWEPEESENWETLGRQKARTNSGREEAWITSRREEAGTTSGREEVRPTSGREEAWITSGRDEARTTSGREEVRPTSGREESWITSGRDEAGTTSDREEADFLEARETECGAVSGERNPEGTERGWVLEEDSRGDQEEVVDEKSEVEVSLIPRQTQVLGTEGVEDEAKDQIGRELAEAQGSEGEVWEGTEDQADQGGEEARGRHDAEITTTPVRLEEEVQAEEASEEKERCWATEAELLQNKEAKETEGEADMEAIPEAGPKGFSGERSEEELQSYQETLGVDLGSSKHEATESQESELLGGPQTPAKEPEEGQGYKEGLWGIPTLSKEDLERGLEEYPNTLWHVEPDSSEAEQRRDTEGGDAQEEKNAEEGEEEGAGGQVLEAMSTGGQECALAEIPAGDDREKTANEIEEGAEEGEAPGGENQELGGRHGADAGTDQSDLGESDPRETKGEEVEAVMPWGTDRMSGRGWSLEEVLSLQDTVASSLVAEMVEDKHALERRAAEEDDIEVGDDVEVGDDIGEAPEREAGDGWDGALGSSWDSEGREEAGTGEEVVEAAEGENVGGQEFGLEGSAEEELTGRNGPAESLEDKGGKPEGEQGDAGESGLSEGSCRVGGFTLGSQGTETEETMTILEAEGLQGGQLLLEKETGDWQVGDQGQGSEGQCGDHTPEKEARRSLEEEDVKVTGDWKAEVEEIDPEGLEDAQGEEGQLMIQILAEAEPELRGEAEGSAEGSAEGDACGSWCEALLPGSRLDVSVPRSRVLLFRSSSQRRSRPSFRRAPAPEQQEQDSSPPTEEEGLSAPEQHLPQPMEPREPSPPRPEQIPVPARRRPLGHGFGLAHSGMMQELQARLGRPKPQ